MLFVRGATYIPVDLIGGLESEYARLDLAIYSPLSLALGLGTAIVARGPRPQCGDDTVPAPGFSQ